MPASAHTQKSIMNATTSGVAILFLANAYELPKEKNRLHRKACGKHEKSIADPNFV